jgi:hypothetical protein
MGNAALPILGLLRGEDEGVEGLKAELDARFGGRRCGGERTRARRSERQHWQLSSPLRARARRKERMEAAAAHRGALRRLAT